MPDKAEKVLNQIRSCHGGSLNDSRFGIRNRGEGPLAKNLKNVARIAKQKYFKEKNFPELNTTLHEQYKEGQLKLF